ncbi:MAG: hypothetical protein B9S32_08315 [Verrucomicrobia bacterium Tous-C9LFEB]|nr:MAG: hypothetical protein B9S32_08315 [Verrucomicrobia bacterium Tous-C9LFEB]
MIFNPKIYSLHLNDPCGRMSCGPGWGRERNASLRLPDLELWFVWKGHGWMKTQNREFTLLPGFCALMRPGGIYDAGHDESHPLGITYIHFDVHSCRTGKKITPTLSRQWPEFFEISDPDYFDTVTRRIVELFPIHPRLGEDILRGLLQDLLQRPVLGQHAAPAPAYGIAALTARIRSSSERLPTVAALATEMHMSAGHFSRLFKKTTGQSPLDFLVETRLARARHLLRETPLSIGEIAERLDYADVYFFSRQFKQKTGVSPLAYRRNG